jgi:tetratricopeptide (TPR) repeat protein
MIRHNFYIAVCLMFVAFMITPVAGQEKTRVKQSETVVFPENGEVGIAVVETLRKPTKIVFTSLETKKKIAEFTLQNGDRYVPFQFESAVNPVTYLRPLEPIEGLPAPLIQAVAVHPGGSDHSFWTILFGEINGRIKMLTPDGTENSIQGGVHIGPLGAGNGSGLAVYNYIWNDDGEAHYDAHRYRVELYKFDASKGTLVKTKSLTTKEKYETKSAALAELGFGFFGNRLNDFPALEDFRIDDAEYDAAETVCASAETKCAGEPGYLKALAIVGAAPRIDLTEEEREAALEEFSGCIAETADPKIRNRCLSYRGYLQRDEKAAAADFAESLKAEPKNPLAFYLRGKRYILANDENRAFEDFEKAAASGSPEAEVYFYLGQLYADNYDDSDKAVANYTKALELKPDFTPALILRAATYAGMKDSLPEAIRDANLLVERFPNGFEGEYFQNMRADLYRRSGEPEKAAADYGAVLKLDPANAEAAEGLESLKEVN